MHVFAQDLSVSSQRYVSNEVIVKFKPSKINLEKNGGMKSMQSFAVDQSLVSESIISDQNISVMKIDDNQSVMEVVHDLQNNPTVVSVQPNFIYTLQSVSPNDTYFPNQR